MDEKPCRNILIYYIGYMTNKILKYVKINSVNSLYLISAKLMGTFRKLIKVSI